MRARSGVRGVSGGARVAIITGVRLFSRPPRQEVRLGNVLPPVSGEIDTSLRAQGTPASGVPRIALEPEPAAAAGHSHNLFLST